MAKTLIEIVRPHVKLYRDPKTGIAWVEDGTSGSGHSCHPNISASGSVAGMKKKGWWGRDDKTVRSHGFIYNVDVLSIGRDDLAELACEHCRCGGAAHEGR
jgi:hypothetical protein